MFNNDTGEIHSLTKAGVVFLVFLFIAIVTYFLLSTPIDIIFDSFESADFAKAEAQKDTIMPLIRTACNIFFALFISIPATWFIFWVFHREASYNEYYPSRRF